MIDNVLNATVQKLAAAGSKAGKAENAPAASSTHLTASENKMADLVALSPSARQAMQDGRRVDQYLQIFKSALQIINGSPNALTSYGYKEAIKFFQPDSKTTFKKEV